MAIPTGVMRGWHKPAVPGFLALPEGHARLRSAAAADQGEVLHSPGVLLVVVVLDVSLNR